MGYLKYNNGNYVSFESSPPWVIFTLIGFGLISFLFVYVCLFFVKIKSLNYDENHLVEFVWIFK